MCKPPSCFCQSFYKLEWSFSEVVHQHFFCFCQTFYQPILPPLIDQIPSASNIIFLILFQMHIQSFPSHLLFLFLFVITLIFPISFGDEDDPFFKCNSTTFNCGKLQDVQYPFTGNGRPDYCGHPGFELNCSNDDPTIEIMSERYRVVEINHRDQILSITGLDFLDNICVERFFNTTLNFTVFEYRQGYTNLTLFYGCSSEYGTPSSVDCPKGVPFEVSFTISEDELPREGQCQNSSIVPVSLTSAVALQNDPSSIEAVVNESFSVRWLVDDAPCLVCIESGGRCGFNSTLNEPTCFCADRPSGRKCPGGKKELDVTVKLIVGFCALAVGILLACLFIYRRRLFGLIKRRNLSPSNSKSNSSSMDFEKGGIWYGVPIFSYDELEEATNNFDSNKELGDGGFGTVYRGKLRDGRVVAVKRLYDNNFKRVEQFMNEVVILTRLRHQNLVTLYGCTSRHCRELLLVYEYVPNGTVADHLHGDRAEAGSLTWPIRMSIAVETASALSYLHASDIIHRDVKTTNILLDNAFHVKVADFGLSRLFPTDVTHISTSPQGTPGYVDPEYHQCYQLTDKSDVYSFGVVLIELISSKPAVDITRHRHEINLANLAINKIQNRTLLELVDPSLGFESDIEVRRMITMVAELAFRCLQPEKELRPSMDEAWEILRGIESEDYKVEKAEIVDILGDHVGLLKNIPPPFSPDSVTLKWVSQSTTPGVSG